MQKPEAATRAGIVLDALRHRAAREGAVLTEGFESSGDVPVHADDVLARVDRIVEQMPPDEVDKPEEFKKAARMLLEHGDPALRKLLHRDEPPESMSSDELGSMEAIVVVNGTRPSFLLRDGVFAKDHPFLGTWHQEMDDFWRDLPAFAACVGRLQLPDGNAADYNGTGTLVPALSGEHLVLTNLHVVVHARTKSKVAMTARAESSLDVKGDWVIDFVGESQNALRNRWRVCEVRLPQGAGVNFSGLDAAVLRVEPFGDESKLPEPAIRLSREADYAFGAGSASLATIGFPGEPNIATPPDVKVDWNWVVKTLFNNRFGLKRIAPGRFKEGAGAVKGDSLGHILSHDATTFGGASGSPVLAWREDGRPSFALHFAGATGVANYAVSIHKAADALEKTGLKLS